MRRRCGTGGVAGLVATVILAGCSTDPISAGPRTAPVTARDVAAGQPAPGKLAPGKHAPELSGVVRLPGARASASGPLAPAQTDRASSVFDIAPNVLVSPQASSAPQNETTISVDPSSPARLVASSNDYRRGDSGCGTYASTDGGASWRDIGTGIQPQPAGYDAGGDPSTAFAPHGGAYFLCLGFSRTTGASGLFVARSTDLRSTRVLTPVVTDTAGSPIFNDKGFMAIDTRPASPYQGRIYVTWTRFDYSGPNGSYVASPIYIAWSSDGGEHWSTPRPVTTPALFANQGSVPAVGPDGAVYIAFENFNTPTSINQMMVARSTDGGRTFAPPVKAGDVADICPRVVFGSCSLLNSSFRVNSFPSLAAGPRRGHLYVVWGDYASGSAKALLARSTDGGASWGRARFVSNASPNDQVFPWVTTAADGMVHVAYYDRRDDPNNFLLSTYLSSADDGLGFGKAVRVSSGPSNPDVQFGGSFIGDYIGVAAAPGRANPIWTDTRRPVFHALKQDAVTSVVDVAGR